MDLDVNAFGPKAMVLAEQGPVAGQVVLDRFAFLGDLDERDRQFLDLARHLLDQPVSEHETEALEPIEHPIAWLMAGVSITPKAAALRADDIRLFARGQVGCFNRRVLRAE